MGKNLVSLIRLEDAFSDIDVYDDMVGSVTSKNISDGTSENRSTSHSYGTGTNQSDSRSQSTTEANGLTNGSGEGVTVTVHNKTVEDMLERINKQLKRMDEFESLGTNTSNCTYNTSITSLNGGYLYYGGLC